MVRRNGRRESLTTHRYEVYYRILLSIETLRWKAVALQVIHLEGKIIQEMEVTF